MSIMASKDLLNVGTTERARQYVTVPRVPRETAPDARQGWHTSQLGLARAVCQPVDAGEDERDEDPWRFINRE